MSSLFGGGGEKEATRQEDIARQREETQNILNSFLSQLVPGSEEYNRLVAEGGRLVQNVDSPENEQELVRQLGQQLVQAQQARIGAGGAATALEERTNRSFQGLRDVAGFSPEEQSLLNALRGIAGTGEPGDAGGVQDIFGQLVSRAQDPNAAFTSTLQPQLQLLQDQVKARAAQRGILGSGLELEDLGRSGVELAIREAAAREDFRQQQLNNFMSLFNAGQSLRGREIGLEEALVNLQQGRESNLTGLLQSQTGNATANLLDLLTRQTTQSTADRLDAADAEAARKAGIGQAIGTTLAVAAAPFTGGASLAAIPTVQSIFGQQQAAGAQVPGGVSQAAGLSRQRTGNDDEEFIRLLRSLSSGSNASDFASSLRTGGF